ncbi:MAG TPA: phosphatase PAP2 family protein [Aquabacterium sp.]|uniref:phosphatase PAP2 family protein n=1 Tax=Aquabacterium sp. TaxID=1872578 RepID=UPI002E35FC84|nr:phosphatase PAP2 family protein [Aquabacterium sp.]HEX5371150.1 phosphatase PAP2 family protein [Aquabacterium sp.]
MTTETESSSLDTRLLWAGLFLSLAIFSKVPNVDLWFSQRYYLVDQGFFQANNPVVQALYRYTPRVGHGLLALAAVVAVGGPWLARLANRWHAPGVAERLTGLWRRTAVGCLLVAVLSSGLIVELGFKNFMGRPRPVQTLDFGGTEVFHPAFERGPSPDRHRSFVSGHAAAGFSLMSIGLAAGAVWRRRWLLIGVVTGSIVGLGRIMQGGHYLSDVVFSFYVVWLSCELIAYGLRQWDLRKLPPHHPARKGPRRALR